ncbi:hypothetical protein NA57DRAFT_43536 [Rhizodiscina lignyota]|uniref:C2H2-type domain-containing protein n=1 Tax=Rhizodiscina lignyota TaxID=1504668 RepID=A0A9P4M2W4_9PEZI|nr:hypothetical protein NA57DRAFT_43536 [Rhizodiscina lignyota]
MNNINAETTGGDTGAVPSLKKHVCHRCDRRFAKLEHLQRHERSHTKVKPYRCTLCPNAFTRKDLLTRHHNLVHTSKDSETTRTLAGGSNHAISQDETTLPPIASLMSPESQSHLTSDISVPDISGAYVNAMDDFGMFMNTISFPTHPFSPSFQPLPFIYGDSPFRVPDQESFEPAPGVSHDHSHPSAVETQERVLGSRLPSLGPDDVSEEKVLESVDRKSHTTVTPLLRGHILDTLSQFNKADKASDIPSTHALSRFVSGYFTWFHGHYPIFHVPTFRLESLSVECILALAALGAQYHREPERGVELFYASHAVVMERIRRRDRRNRENGDSLQDLDRQASNSNAARACITSDWEQELHLDGTAVTDVEIIICLTLLIAMSTWFRRRPLVREAWGLRSILDSVMRDASLAAPDETSDISWTSWAHIELVKRSKLIAYCFFNIHTIIFDLPPVILFNDLRLKLPCTEREWQAKNEAEWNEMFVRRNNELEIQKAYQRLFATDEGDGQTRLQISTLGGYILIHALIQDIWWLHRASRIPLQLEGQSFKAQIECVEKALKRWSACWEQNQESSMNPMNEYGPLSFTSTALLRLAYIRINLGVDAIQSLSSWDADSIALAMMNSPPVQRSARLTRAALHCAHGLSIPIKLGINFVAQNQVIHWSNAHAICSRECALLLAKWLEAVAIPYPEPPLDSHENRLLSFVIDMVQETEFGAPAEELLLNERRLSSIVVKLWAKLFRPDSVWELVDLIGTSLNAYGNMLERQ